MMGTALRVALIALVLVACDESAPPEEEGKPLPPAELLPPGLDAREILVRASLDVRGVRPTEDELARLEADEGALETILDEMVNDRRIGDQIGTIFAEALRLRGPIAVGYLDGAEHYRFEVAANEQAVNLVRYVATTDRPFVEILTSELTIVDELLLQELPSIQERFLPLEPVDPQPADLPAGTVMARYTDGRPASGVIASFSFSWKIVSNVGNAQRARANALSRGLLCQDYLDRPIDFPTDVPLSDSNLIAEAIKTVDACQACHATLDPLASHLWSLWTIASLDMPDLQWSSEQYNGDKEGIWTSTTGVPPGYYGSPSSNGIGALATAIADDPRFVSCSVRRVYEAFLGRPAVLADEGQLELHREVFADSGLSMRALVRSVLDDPAYRGRKERSALGGAPEPVREKLATPEILASSLTDLTGFPFTLDGRSSVRFDAGLRTIAGASEAGALGSPSPGRVLVHRRFAEASAMALVGERIATTSRRLVTGMDLSREPTPKEIAVLMLRVWSRHFEPDSPDVAELLALWREVAAASGSNEEAWSALLTALLADPDVAIY